MISDEARLAFLRRLHIFHDLREEELAVFAAKLEEVPRREKEKIFSQGSAPDRFYILQHGSVRLTRSERGQPRLLATLVEGDFFGEEELLTARPRAASAEAAEDCVLLTIKRSDFALLVKQFPRFKKALDVAVSSRNLAREAQFDWLNPGEVIYFLARKHEVVLFQGLSGPVIALVAPIFLLFHFFLSRSFFAIFGAGLLFVLIVAWAVWNWIDWGNDFYLVTNKRVIWLEKVIGLYDSRQEAPLGTILSVGAETDLSGRMLDYGNVVVRTYTGKIVFSHVAHPYEATHLIEEQWTRTKRSASRQEKEAMRNVLRKKMGLPVEVRPEEQQAIDTTTTPTIYRRSMVNTIVSRWFKLRVEDSGTITYRKHWFVLGRQTAQPTVLVLLVLFGMIARLLTLARTPGQVLFDSSRALPIDTTMLALPTLLIPIIAWWVYQYLDWRNDIYMVTPEEILDIDRKPFGTQTRRAAPLENILSTEAERLGLAGYLFNFGTVYISVGAANLDFEDVLDPTAVQADIDRRREARAALRRELEASVERERISDWLLAYHENQGDLPPRPENGKPESKSG